MKKTVLIHPVLHIVDADIEFADTTKAYLLVQVAEGFIGFVSFYPDDKKVNGWIMYTIDKNETVTTLQEKLAGIAVAEQWIHSNYKKILLLMQTSKNIPVPVVLNKEEGKEALFELMFGKQKNELHLKDIVLQQSLINHYAVDGSIASVLNRKFAKGEWWHVQSLLMSKPASTAATITATIWLNELHLTAERNGAWLLLQTYMYQTPEDALYIILNSMQQLNITQEECTVMLQGMIDQRSPLFDMLQLYILNLKLNDQLVYRFPANDQHPVHLFSSLDQVLTCVS